MAGYKDTPALVNVNLVGNILTDATAKLLLDENTILNKGCILNLDNNFIREKLKVEIARKVNRLRSPSKVFSKYVNRNMIRSNTFAKQPRKEKLQQEQAIERLDQQAAFIVEQRHTVELEHAGLKEQWRELLGSEEEFNNEIVRLNKFIKDKLPNFEVEGKEIEKEMLEIQNKYESKLELLEAWLRDAEGEANTLEKELAIMKAKLNAKNAEYMPVIKQYQDEFEEAQVKLYVIVSRIIKIKIG